MRRLWYPLLQSQLILSPVSDSFHLHPSHISMILTRTLRTSITPYPLQHLNPCIINAFHTSSRTPSKNDDLDSENLFKGTKAINDEMFHLFGSIEDQESQTIGRNATPQQLSLRSITTARRLDHDNSRLTHTDDNTGRATMVDITSKSSTIRSATASARVILGYHAFSLVAANKLKKGDVLTVAQLAGIMGAKQTSSLIPLCHPLLLSHVEVSLELEQQQHAVDIIATVATTGPTGVEMEAMTAAAVSALTIYDMCKAASKGIEISDIRLLHKSGGKSGDWKRSS